MMDFQNKYSRWFRGTDIEYGLIEGSSTIVLIKAGLNGTIYGYEKKYLQVAKKLNHEYGCTVFCSSNPAYAPDSLQDAFDLIREYCSIKAYKESRVFYMGHSDGGLYGAQCGFEYPEIERMLLINTPLMMNWGKTKSGLEAFAGKSIAMIYGEFDPSVKYLELLNIIDNEALSCYVVAGQDHHFSREGYDFKELAVDYLMR